MDVGGVGIKDFHDELIRLVILEGSGFLMVSLGNLRLYNGEIWTIL